MASSSRQILLLMKKFENLDVPSVVPNVDQAGTVYEFGIKRRNRTTAKEQTNLRRQNKKNSQNAGTNGKMAKKLKKD